MQLGPFSPTRLEQHWVRRTDTHELTSFALGTPSSVVLLVVCYIENSIFSVNASLCASRVTTSLGNTVHLHATHVILIIGGMSLLYSLIYLIKRTSFLLVPTGVRFATLERATRGIRNQDTLLYMLCTRRADLGPPITIST